MNTISAQQNYAFGRGNRLLNATDFSYVFNNATRSSDQFFTVIATKTDRTHARLGLAIAKKSLKKAHDRNLVKRITRESFRLNQETLTGLDLVVMVKPKIPLENRNQLHQSLINHWKRILRRCSES